MCAVAIPVMIPSQATASSLTRPQNSAFVMTETGRGISSSWPTTGSAVVASAATVKSVAMVVLNVVSFLWRAGTC